MPIGAISYFSGSIASAAMTFAALLSETSCSPERPPNRTATLTRPWSANSFERSESDGQLLHAEALEGDGDVLVAVDEVAAHDHAVPELGVAHLQAGVVALLADHGRRCRGLGHASRHGLPVVPRAGVAVAARPDELGLTPARPAAGLTRRPVVVLIAGGEGLAAPAARRRGAALQPIGAGHQLGRDAQEEARRRRFLRAGAPLAARLRMHQ